MSARLILVMWAKPHRFLPAAGAPLVYASTSVPRPHNEAVLVPKGSTLQKVLDLKGKKIALNKGSNVHYLAGSSC